MAAIKIWSPEESKARDASRSPRRNTEPESAKEVAPTQLDAQPCRLCLYVGQRGRSSSYSEINHDRAAAFAVSNSGGCIQLLGMVGIRRGRVVLSQGFWPFLGLALQSQCKQFAQVKGSRKVTNQSPGSLAVVAADPFCCLPVISRFCGCLWVDASWAHKTIIRFLAQRPHVGFQNPKKLASSNIRKVVYAATSHLDCVALQNLIRRTCRLRMRNHLNWNNKVHIRAFASYSDESTWLGGTSALAVDHQPWAQQTRHWTLQ